MPLLATWTVFLAVSVLEGPRREWEGPWCEWEGPRCEWEGPRREWEGLLSAPVENVDSADT